MHLEVADRQLLKKGHTVIFSIKTFFLQFMRLSSSVVFYWGIYKDCARWKPEKPLNVPVPCLFE